VRPTIRFLTDELIQKIVSEATGILCTLGIEIYNKTVLTMLSDFGCRIDMEEHHAVLTQDSIDKALKAAPESFGLYDVTGKQTHDFSGRNVYFTPGSTHLDSRFLILVPLYAVSLSGEPFPFGPLTGLVEYRVSSIERSHHRFPFGIAILDSQARKMRKPVTDGYVNFVKVAEQLEHIASTSTALIPADVPEGISDSYRLFLSLLYGRKPVVTGAFTIESFNVMSKP